MKRLNRAAGYPSAVLATWAATLLLPSPAWANNPDFQQLRYPFFLWPAAALLSLMLLAMAKAMRRVRRPARRLGWALISLSATALLGWPYVVYEKGFGFALQNRTDDLIAIMPVLVAALVGLVAGYRATGATDA
jgi:hypothetical protein